ncbi:hypothetical protein PHYPO_G00024660 [Pangasianodon hypophthalmus]|uniref:Uncharacterized protein n=1 Tax=Pangasianodon hypophthalmus TaxID=310915 RepID=A0A5N5MX43_PANHP|nr:hypothetical protein PHYPO_G00024660 [Pangasianodon hypophthalmus]
MASACVINVQKKVGRGEEPELGGPSSTTSSRSAEQHSYSARDGDWVSLAVQPFPRCLSWICILHSQ